MRNYVNLQNTSMKNYVDNQIISNEYDDSWINQTIYNTTQVNAINTSMKNYVDAPLQMKITLILKIHQ